MLLFDASDFFENFFVGAISIIMFCYASLTNAKICDKNALYEFHLIVVAGFLVIRAELNNKTPAWYENSLDFTMHE